MPMIPPIRPTWLGGVQRRFGEMVRARVAGDNAAERADDIWGKPGRRWFTPDDPIWVVHADASMFVGGLTALLLQSLHPLAMAGVAGHSGYRSDPWGRLERTSHYIAVTTYGTIDDAEATIARVRAVHDRVRGKDHTGRAYRASDSHLLAWVHAAEIWSFLTAFRAFGAGKVEGGDADLYVEQTAVPARLLGVADAPTTVAELTETVEGFRDELEVSPDSLDVVSFLLREPPLSGVSRVGFDMLSAGAVAILPAWGRDMLDLTVPPAAMARGRFAVGAVRWGLAGVEDARRSNPPRG